MSEKEAKDYVIDTGVLKKLDKNTWFFRSKGEIDGSIAIYLCEDDDEGISFDIVHERYRGISHSVCCIRLAIWGKYEIE